MQKLVACHMEKVKKPELSTTSILKGADRLKSEDAPTIASTAFAVGELLLMLYMVLCAVPVGNLEQP